VRELVARLDPGSVPADDPAADPEATLAGSDSGAP